MSSGTAAPAASQLSRRLRAFVVERYPFALGPAVAALDAVAAADPPDAAGVDALRAPFTTELRSRLESTDLGDAVDVTPGVSAGRRFAQAIDEILEACDGLLRRAAIAGSLTADERREILRGMVL